MNSKILILFFGLFGLSTPYPSAVPESACESMVPGHGHGLQLTQSPFEIALSSFNARPGGVIEVTLRSRGNGNERFKGFYIQARDGQDQPIGVFNKNSETGTHSCNNLRNNAAHHVNNAPKDNIKIIWTAPLDYRGPITFTATFVKEFHEFWVQTRAAPITVS